MRAQDVTLPLTPYDFMRASTEKEEMLPGDELHCWKENTGLVLELLIGRLQTTHTKKTRQCFDANQISPMVDT